MSAMSINTKLDTDDCACLTPSGCLVLALNKVTYEELGIEGHPSYFCRQKPATRYVVTIDLAADHFKPGKKNYERVLWCLTDRLHLKLNFLMSWDPPEAKTCPSSVAAYFASRGFQVELCRSKVNQRRDTSVVVPSLGECDNEELLEWLGAYSIEADLETGAPDSFVNTYQPPGENQIKLQVAYLQWSGFFTTLQVHTLFEHLKSFVESRATLPWASLHVQGFDDSPVSWGLQEHHFLQNGDNAYTVFLQPDGHFLLCQTLGARRKMLTRSRRTARC